jgi:hypothetical protein
MKPKILLPLLFLIVVPSLLFSLRFLSSPGGDSAWIASLVERPLYFFIRAPLVVALHKTIWLGLRGWGWTPAECIALSSSVAGGVFLWGLFRFSRDPRIWAVVLLSKFSLIFLGHVETYAWPYALAMWVFVGLKDYGEGEPRSTLRIWLLLTLAAYLHPLTLMLWPGALWGLWPLGRKDLERFLGTLLAATFLLILLLLFGKTGGFPQAVWILPLFDVGETLARYPLFSWVHWSELLRFHLTTLPLGLFLLIFYGCREWRGWERALLASAGITLLWSLVWHPGMGMADWDLFAWPALSVNLAGAYAWSRAGKKETAPAENPEAPDGNDVTKANSGVDEGRLGSR